MKSHHPIRKMHIDLRRWSEKLNGPAWFPHLPVTALVLVASTWLLATVFRGQGPSLFEQLANARLTIAPHLLPVVVIAGGLMILSVGLALRSRIAWAMTTFLIVTTLFTGLFVGYPWPAALPVFLGAVSLVLVITWRSFNHASIAATTLFLVSLIGMLLCYATYGSLYLGNHFHPPVEDLVSALYFAVVTMSTVGYGDFTPQTTEAKLFSISLIVFGVAVFATTLTALVTPVLNKSMDRIANRKTHKMKRENHFVVLGQSALANNTCNELRQRGQPVTRILQRAPDEAIAKDADVVVGDCGRIDTLTEAGCNKALGILAMFEDDAENAFAILAVREMGSTARTVAASAS